MKEKIHPAYHQIIATCACGASYRVGSTRKTIRVEICSHCHPFYTGSQQRIVDTAGRIERFKRKYGMK